MASLTRTGASAGLNLSEKQREFYSINIIVSLSAVSFARWMSGVVARS